MEIGQKNLCFRTRRAKFTFPVKGTKGPISKDHVSYNNYPITTL
jgi:hypothetical protein